MSLAVFDFTDRVRPVIEIGIGDSRSATGAIWDVGRWDTTGHWAGIEPHWLDVTCDVQTVGVQYGRQSVTDRFVVGQATVTVDNATGWADPNTDDPPGELSVRPGRQIRVSVVHAVYGPHVLFRGYIDAMIPVYSPTVTDQVQLVCNDALGEVNRAKLVPVDPPVGASETASARTVRILDAINWIPRDVRPSSEPLIATDLGGQVADLLGVTADSCGGVVFGDLDGRVAFRPRDWQTYPPEQPVDGTIGNVEVTDVCPVQWERPFERADIATRAIMGRDLETAVQIDDDDGILLYGIEPFERTDLLTERDSALLVLAERVLRVRGPDTAPRVRSVTLSAATSDAAADLMSTVDVYLPSRYRCRLAYPEPRGVVFDGEYFATGVSHNLTPASWDLNLNLDVAEPFMAVGGRWDVSGWDQALWADVAALLDEARTLIGVLS